MLRRERNGRCRGAARGLLPAQNGSLSRAGRYLRINPNSRAQTDDEGRFRIGNLCAGKVTLCMAGAPGRSAAEGDAGATDVRPVRRAVPYSTVPVVNPNRLP